MMSYELTVPLSQPLSARQVLRRYRTWQVERDLLQRKLERSKVLCRSNPALVEQLDARQRMLARVDSALEDMAVVPDLAHMLRVYYCDRTKAGIVADDMGYSERQFFRYLKNAVELFAFYYDTED